LPAASEKSQILPDPDNPQDLAHRPCDVQPATQGHSTILPREDLLAKTPLSRHSTYRFYTWTAAQKRLLLLVYDRYN